MNALPLVDQTAWEQTQSGLFAPARPKRPIGIDLFCGAGGFSLGMIQGGFHVVAAADNDPNAAVTYMHNLGEWGMKIHPLTEEDENRLNEFIEDMWRTERKGRILTPTVAGGNKPDNMPGCQHFFFGDIRKLTGKRILDALGLQPGEVDVVFGGPPCQGFSYAGRRNVMDPRNSLVFDFVRLVLEIQPTAMMMENVPGMLTMTTTEGIPVIDAIYMTLEEGGFGTYDALRRSLLNTSGAGMATRKTSGPFKGGRPKTKAGQAGQEAEQISLLDEVTP